MTVERQELYPEHTIPLSQPLITRKSASFSNEGSAIELRFGDKTERTIIGTDPQVKIYNNTYCKKYYLSGGSYDSW